MSTLIIIFANLAILSMLIHLRHVHDRTKCNFCISVQRIRAALGMVLSVVACVVVNLAMFTIVSV